MGCREFEVLARRVFSARFAVPLTERIVPPTTKRFDFASDDFSVVGDAKYYTLVGGTRLPPAKFSVIAEHVWLLEKTLATTRFLVFGNQREVPIQWLDRYGHLAKGVSFYFMSDEPRWGFAEGIVRAYNLGTTCISDAFERWSSYRRDVDR